MHVADDRPVLGLVTGIDFVNPAPKLPVMYPVHRVDSQGQKLSGANRYVLRFPPGQLPPVDSFWSLTMYGLSQSLLVAIPIDRYLINAPMLPQLKSDADGGRRGKR